MKGLAKLSLLYGQELAKEALEIYYEELKELTDALFVARTKNIIRTRKTRSIPTPADFLDSDTDLDREASRASGKIIRALKVGLYNGAFSVVFYDDPTIYQVVKEIGGKDFLLSVNPKDFNFLRKDLISAYKSAQGCQNKHPVPPPGAQYAMVGDIGNIERETGLVRIEKAYSGTPGIIEIVYQEEKGMVKI